MSRLDDLFDALVELRRPHGESKATSIRQPAALHRAAQIATELGMDESFTAATNRALAERIRAFARQQALVAHLDRFPEDRPQLAAVVLRRLHGTGHPAERRPELVEAASRWIEDREPGWILVAADETIDQVVRYVEMIAEGVGLPRAATA
ncbi:MAG: hypothetical protein ACRD0K_01520 [Egibacteraceae bacterium]